MKRDEYEMDELQKQEIKRVESLKKARGVAMLLSGIVYAAFAVYALTMKTEILSLPKAAMVPILFVIAVCEALSGAVALNKLDRFRKPYLTARLGIAPVCAAAGLVAAVLVLAGKLSTGTSDVNNTDEALTNGIKNVIFAFVCLLFSAGMLCKFFRDRSIIREETPRIGLQVMFMLGVAPLFLLLFIGSPLLMWAAFVPLALGLVSGCILLFTPESHE